MTTLASFFIILSLLLWGILSFSIARSEYLDSREYKDPWPFSVRIFAAYFLFWPLMLLWKCWR